MDQVLATRKFVRSGNVDRQYTLFRRETHLLQGKAYREFTCGGCRKTIATGESCAAGNWLHYCPDCYQPLPERVAQVAIRFDGLELYPYQLREYRGRDLHDFGAAVVIQGDEGQEYRFVGVPEAQAFVDATYALAGSLLGALA